MSSDNSNSSSSSGGTNIVGALVFLFVWYRLYLWLAPTHALTSINTIDIKAAFFSLVIAIPAVTVVWLFAILPLIAFVILLAVTWFGGKEAVESLKKRKAAKKP